MRKWKLAGSERQAMWGTVQHGSARRLLQESFGTPALSYEIFLA